MRLPRLLVNRARALSFIGGGVGAHLQPGVDGVDRGRADGHRACFVALAGHGKQSGVAIDIFDIHRGEFRQAQAGGVEQLCHRLVPSGGWPFLLEYQVAIDLVRVQCFGQFARFARRLHTRRGIAGIAVFPAQVVEEGASGGETALDTAARQAPAMHLAHPVADIGLVQRRGRSSALGFTERLERIQVALVIRKGVGESWRTSRR